MKIKAIDYVSYMVSDLKRSMNFYKDILGLKLSGSGDGWAEFDVGNMSLDIVQSDNVTKGGGGAALAVDDIEATLVELKGKGVKVASDGWETPVCHGASIEDPDGNVIYLHHRKDETFG